MPVSDGAPGVSAALLRLCFVVKYSRSSAATLLIRVVAVCNALRSYSNATRNNIDVIIKVK
jgi:organic hydroperoxide reductase OsmC/OhrA